MLIKANSLTELLNKLSSLAEDEDTRPSPDVEVEHAADPVDTFVRLKVAALVMEHCNYDTNEDLVGTMQAVHGFVTA